MSNNIISAFSKNAQNTSKLQKSIEIHNKLLNKVSLTWVGKISEHFEKISRIATYINGYAFKSEFLDLYKKVPVIRIGDIQNGILNYDTCLKYDELNNLNNYLLKKNDIVIALSGATVGKTAYVTSERLAYINQRVGIIRNASKYLLYCLNTDTFGQYINFLSLGSAQPNISMRQIRNFPIPSISRDEQQKIADYLDDKCGAIDEIISKTEQSIEEYKKLKQSVITKAVTKGIRPNRPMQDSDIEWIGEIPQDWEIKKIKYLFRLRDERNTSPLSEVNLISLYTDLGVIQHCDIEATTGNKAQTADGYKKVYNDDIVVNIILCWMGAIGRSAYDGVTSPAYDVYKPIDNTNSRFYHYYFRTKGFNGECYQVGRGIMLMRWRTYSEQFKAIKVVVPPLDEQKEIADYLDEKCAKIDTLIQKKQQFLAEMANYKKSLIYEYVTGKKEVA